MADTAQLKVGWLDVFREGRGPKVVAFCLAVWLHAADSLMVATTLPSAVAEIGGAAYVGWAYTLYLLGSIVIGAATGLLTIRFGIRWGFLVAGGLFALGCVISAVAPSMEVLLVGRFIQGLGGGWQVALVYVALDRLFPNYLMPKLIAMSSAVWSVSAFCGPLVGGAFANAGEWRLAYWAFAGQAVLFIVLVAFTVPRGKAADSGATQSIPLLRLLLVAGGVLLIATAGAHPDSVEAPLLVVGAAIVLGAFLRIDGNKRGNAMLPPSPFSPRRTYGAGFLMVTTLAIGTMSLIAYGTFFFERLYDQTPLAAGFIIAIESVAWGVAAVVFATASLALERWLIRGGALTIAIGVIGLMVTMPLGNLFLVLPFVALQGAGFGMMWGFVIRRVVADAAPGERERTSAAVATTQQFGYAVGAASAGIVANALGFAEEASIATIQEVAFWIFAAFVPVTFIGVWAAWRLSRDEA
jgi:MFS family permease